MQIKCYSLTNTWTCSGNGIKEKAPADEPFGLLAFLVDCTVKSRGHLLPHNCINHYRVWMRKECKDSQIVCIHPFPCLPCLTGTANLISSTCSWQQALRRTPGCLQPTRTTCVGFVECKPLHLCWAGGCVAGLAACTVVELWCPSSDLEFIFVVSVFLRDTRMGHAEGLECLLSKFFV